MYLQSAHTGKNEWWRYLLTILVVVIGTVIGQLPLYFAVMSAGISKGYTEFEVAEMINTLDLGAIGFSQNLTILLMLLAFVFALIALWLAVRFIHKKPFRLLITPFSRINWRKIMFAFSLWMGLTILTELVFYAISPGDYHMQFQPGPFLGLLAISLLVLPLQTSFEELFFRGYLMQGVSLISRYRWIPLVLTSLAFGLMHWMNPEVEAFGTGITMVYYIGVGLFLGILTLMDDSLELALGIHAATNIYGALFVTFDESAIQTAAIFHNSEVHMGYMLAGFIVAIFIFTYIVSKKYNWTNWSKCYGLVDRLEEPAV